MNYISLVNQISMASKLPDAKISIKTVKTTKILSSHLKLKTVRNLHPFVHSCMAPPQITNDTTIFISSMMDWFGGAFNDLLTTSTNRPSGGGSSSPFSRKRTTSSTNIFVEREGVGEEEIFHGNPRQNT